MIEFSFETIKKWREENKKQWEEGKETSWWGW